MSAHPRLVAGFAALVVLTAVTAFSVVSAGAVDEPARVGVRAWRVDPPAHVTDPRTRVRLDLLEVVNATRADGALSELQLHDRVSAAAQAHADYLASVRELSHAGPGGTDTGFRLQQAGFSWVAWGENIGAGFVDPQVLVDRWMASPPHRSQLFGDYRYAGVGVATTPDGVRYWVLVLAS